MSKVTHYIETRVRERRIARKSAIERELGDKSEPLVLRGAVEHWPAVQKAKGARDDFKNYILSFASEAEVGFFSGGPELNGRIFYNEDFSGLNCTMQRAPLATVLNELTKNAASGQTALRYMGSTPVARYLPGFEHENQLDLNVEKADAYIWIGGPSRISAHYDFSENLACVVAGRRQFILFPPDQLANLYIGPLEFSPAGQPISLIDFHNPDFDEFPRLRTALESALIADLEPGDAIFIPSMWWHHVEAFSPVNVLLNYWWGAAPAFLGAPKDALEHAMMTLRDLPADQKAAWRELFNHYVFENSKDTAAHVPPHVRGMLNPMTQEEARRIRALLFNRLNT